MAIDKQQLHVQAYSLFTEPSIQSIGSLYSKPSLSSSSPELDSAPGTPVRVSSSGKAFAALTPQSSQEEVCSDELRAALQPFHHVAASPPSVMAQQQEAEQQRAAAKQTAAVMIACLTWVVISSATILINKHMMVDLSFHFPAAVSALGMFGTTVASFLVCRVFKLVPCKVTITPYFFWTRIMTTGFLIALSFQAGNTAYLYLSVAFVQMLKAFTPVSTMLSSFMFGLEKPSAKLIAAVGCISLGVVVSSFGEVNFSTFGVLAMLTSIAAEGVRTCLMQHMLSSKQFHPLEAWMYLGPACIIWLLLLIGLVEGQAIREQQALSIVAAHKWYFAFAALAGFAVNALAMMVIKLASALTLKVLGVCKDVGLVTFGVLLLGENVAVLQVGGYGIALCGFAAYNYIKAFTPALPALELPKVGKGSKGLSRQDSIVYLSSSNGSSDGSSNIKKKKGLSTVSSRSSTASHSPHQQQQQFKIAASYSSSDATHPLLAPTVPRMLCVKSPTLRR